MAKKILFYCLGLLAAGLFFVGISYASLTNTKINPELNKAVKAQLEKDDIICPFEVLGKKENAREVKLYLWVACGSCYEENGKKLSNIFATGAVTMTFSKTKEGFSLLEERNELKSEQANVQMPFILELKRNLNPNKFNQRQDELEKEFKERTKDCK